MKLHTFKGGLQLAAQKDAALSNPIRRMPLPDRLVFPLNSRTGYRYDPAVHSGDTVVRGQVIATAAHDRLAPLLASASGILRFENNDSLGLTPSGEAGDKYVARNTTTTFNEQLHAGGILGLGGAAFPASRKLDSISEHRPDTLLINAAECEPMISCDQALMREHAVELVEGIHLLLKHTQAARCLIGIEDNKPTETAQLRQALGKHTDPRVTLVTVPTLYPTGGERQLIRVMTGRYVPYQQLPRDVGVVCFNIATALAVKRLIKNHEPLLRRIVTVTGDAISQPANIDVLFGTPIGDLIRFVEPELTAIVSGADALNKNVTLTLGGPMTGVTTIDIEQPVTAATNCLVINYRQTPAPVSPCIRCGYCDEVCPAELLPQQLHWYCRNGDYVNAQKFKLDACIECGCCDHVCPSNLPLTAGFAAAKATIEDRYRSLALADQAKTRFENRLTRLERREQLKRERLEARKKSTSSIQATLAKSLSRSRARKQRKDTGGPSS